MNDDHAKIAALIDAGETVPFALGETCMEVHKLLTQEERVKLIQLMEEPDYLVELMLSGDGVTEPYSFEQRIEFASQLMDHKWRSEPQGFIALLATEFAERDPKAAREWLSKFTGADYALGMGLQKILLLVHEQDPDASLAMLKSLNDSEAEQLTSYGYKLPKYDMPTADWLTVVKTFESRILRDYLLGIANESQLG